MLVGNRGERTAVDAVARGELALEVGRREVVRRIEVLPNADPGVVSVG